MSLSDTFKKYKIKEAELNIHYWLFGPIVSTSVQNSVVILI